jgi:hypothetical protein
MLVVQNLLNVQSVLAPTPGDLVDQDGHFGNPYVTNPTFSKEKSVGLTLTLITK